MNLPAACEGLGKPLPPPIPTAGQDPRITAALYAAWGHDNASRLRDQTACEKRVRARFAAGK